MFNIPPKHSLKHTFPPLLEHASSHVILFFTIIVIIEIIFYRIDIFFNAYFIYIFIPNTNGQNVGRAFYGRHQMKN